MMYQYQVRAVINDHDDHCYNYWSCIYDFLSEAEQQKRNILNTSKVKRIWIDKFAEREG